MWRFHPHFSFTLAFTEGFGSLFTMHISCETKWLSDHCAERRRGRGGRSAERRTRWTKGERKGEVKPSPLAHYRSRSWRQTKENRTFTHNSLRFKRLQGKGEEVKVVFRKQRMRTRARKGGGKERKVRRFPRIGHRFVFHVRGRKQKYCCPVKV